MRRVMWALLGTVMGTTLLVGLKSQALMAPGDTVAAGQDPAGDDTIPAGPGGDQPSAAPQPGQTSAKPGTTPRPGQTSAKPGTSTATTKAPTATTTAPAAPKTVTGVAIAVKTAQSPTAKGSPCGDCHNYSMSVTITVSGGKITAASVSYNTPPGGSLSFYNKAVNALKPKTIGATTWMLGKVSGATYSGNAYELSLKSAMSKAGLPV